MTIAPFLSTIVLLVLVTVVSRLGVRPPAYTYVLFAVAGVAVNYVLFGLGVAALSAGAGLLLFVLLVGVAASRVSGVAIFTIAASVAGLAWWYWWTLAAGLGAALLVSLVHIRRAGGAGRVSFLTLETMQAFGVTPVGGVMKPDLDRIPVAEKSNGSDEVADPQPETGPRIRVPEFLLAGVLVGAALAVLLPA